jgi:hypothetical protein
VRRENSCPQTHSWLIPALEFAHLTDFRLCEHPIAPNPLSPRAQFLAKANIQCILRDMAKKTPIANLWQSLLERMDVRVPFVGDSTDALMGLA